MSFLSPKERVMDIILTDEGRKKLSAGKLQMKYYRFFDDEVDYQSPYEGQSYVIEPTGSIPAEAVLFGDGETVVVFGDSEDIVLFGS